MQVSEWIARHPAEAVRVSSDDSIDHVAKAFLSTPGLRDLYVVDDHGLLLGVIHHRQLAQTLLAEHLPVQSSRLIMGRISDKVARDLMNREIVSAHPNEALDNVVHRMLEYQVENMPVLDDSGHVVGMIDLTEILNAVHRNSL